MPSRTSSQGPIAWFARSYGEAALGTFLLLWTCIELGARLSTLGLDRGLQRWADARRAAVLLVLHSTDPGWSIPAIVRPESMKSHAGQVSLPGGLIEP